MSTPSPSAESTPSSSSCSTMVYTPTSLSAPVSPELVPATVPKPCAACRFLRRKCKPECVFAPYFPPEKPDDFARVHHAYGASNVSKLLEDLAPELRPEAARSLVYEATVRSRDPVDGSLGVVHSLQRQRREVLEELARARMELSLHESPKSARSTIEGQLMLPSEGLAGMGLGFCSAYGDGLRSPVGIGGGNNTTNLLSSGAAGRHWNGC